MNPVYIMKSNLKKRKVEERGWERMGGKGKGFCSVPQAAGRRYLFLSGRLSH